MQQYLNYDIAIFQFVCYRKHFLSDVTYHAYLLPQLLIISAVIHIYYPIFLQEPKSQNPKYLQNITLEDRFYWRTKENPKELEAFGFVYKEKVKYFHTSIENLTKLKSLLSNKIMYREISDLYTPSKYLGKGASSKVYLVTESLDKKMLYASKCVEKYYLMEDGGFVIIDQYGFFLEISNIRDLKHKNILSLKEVYEGQQTFYMIVEYLKGESLHQYLNKIDRLTYPQISFILEQILQAVAYIHEKGLMHRDLKPENIMFKQKDDIRSLKIVDFGLSLYDTTDPYTFPKCGTPGYVAPEIANLQNLSFRYSKVCDMFSVGCIFYKMITQRDLFRGKDYDTILNLNKKCLIDLSNLQLYKTPPQAFDLLKKMLQIDPNKRITAKEALQHEFFSQKMPGVIKQKFQKPEKKTQTQCFTPSPVQIKETSNFMEDCDVIEDESSQQLIKVPVQITQQKMQKDKFIMKPNLRQNKQMQKDLAQNQMKKFSSQDFFQEKIEAISPRNSGTFNHPSFIGSDSKLQMFKEDSISEGSCQQSPQKQISPQLLNVMQSLVCNFSFVQLVYFRGRKCDSRKCRR